MKHLTISLIAVLLTAGTAYAQGTVRVTAARANVRSAPNQKSAIVARVPAGTVFQLRSVQGDWYRVQLPGGRATGSDDTAGAAGVGAAMGAGAAGATVFPVNRETFLEMNALGRACLLYTSDAADD